MDDSDIKIQETTIRTKMEKLSDGELYHPLDIIVYKDGSMSIHNYEHQGETHAYLYSDQVQELKTLLKDVITNTE